MRDAHASGEVIHPSRGMAAIHHWIPPELTKFPPVTRKLAWVPGEAEHAL